VTAQPFLATAGAQDWLASETTVQKLARQIDKLEQHLDCYGTVVPKSPDVWGQARLTKYRVEYEKQMKEQLGKFEVTLNASISRSDQAFLASTLALQAAISGDAAVQSQPVIRAKEVKTPVPVYNPAGQLVYDQFGNVVTGTRTQTTGFEESEQFSPILIPSAPTPPEFMNPKFAGTATLREKEIIGFGTGDVAIEPTLKLDQMSRYVNHLHELRRINDGDDKADAPGYGLHLVRIPVSVLPGKKTSEGYGAEITVTAKPHLHDQLLPITFKGLVINDLVDHFAFPLAKFLDSEESEDILASFEVLLIKPEIEQASAVIGQKVAAVKALAPRFNQPGTGQQAVGLLTEITSLLGILARKLPPAGEYSKLALANISAIEGQVANLLKKLAEHQGQVSNVDSLIISLQAEAPEVLKGALEQANNPVIDSDPATQVREVAILRSYLEKANESAPIRQQNYLRTHQQAPESAADRSAKILRAIRGLAVGEKEIVEGLSQICGPECQALQSELDAIRSQLDSLATSTAASTRPALAIPAVSVMPSRRSTMPFPTSQAFVIYGGMELGLVARQAKALKQDALQEKAVLLLDMQKLLAEEFNSAYEYLRHNEGLWVHCTQGLAAAVRRHDVNGITLMRRAFMADLNHSAAAYQPARTGDATNHVEAMAWAIIVESALLNERLVQDMAEIAAAKNNFCVNTQWLPYFHPHPCPEAVASFNAYVECRWPIHVVAVEPVTDDQNVADMFSQTRELQLALSMAFASGRIGAQSFTRMAQKISLDMETIALNRTMVAFSHGDDTFGWRFYPRVQSPDTESPCKATMRMLFTGGPTRDYLLKNRRLEPGTRECTAVVIMPSFVPYVVFDTRCNWFKLTNPREKELDVRNGVNLSADITQLRCLTQTCVADAHKYRSNETHRLTRAVDQLEQRLPLQTVFAQMPFENSLGGFEFFNSGVPDLAPELNGFYGEPGVLIGDGKVSTLFLVGDHFSVHETKVMVGNRLCDAELLSRQVMRVFVPGDVNVVDNSVDAHVATPYGVSNHLVIPVYVREVVTASATVAVPPPTDTFAWTSSQAIPIQICLDGHNLPLTVCLQGAPGIKTESTTPFSELTEADFRAMITVNPGKDVKAKGQPMAVDKVAFKNGVARFDPKPGVCDQPFESKLKDALVANGVIGLKDGDVIQLDGYLRTTTDAKTANSPPQIFRLLNRLNLVVSIAKTPVPAACTSAPATAAFDPATLFDAPRPLQVSQQTLAPTKAPDPWEVPRYIEPPTLPAPPRR
jgi:hypothetical protein